MLNTFMRKGKDLGPGPLINGFGRPKNMWIRIPNTGFVLKTELCWDILGKPFKWLFKNINTRVSLLSPTNIFFQIHITGKMFVWFLLFWLFNCRSGFSPSLWAGPRSTLYSLTSGSSRYVTTQSVLRIRDVYPQIPDLIFIHPGSNNSTKRGEGKILLGHTIFFCSHKFLKIVNN